MGEGIYRDIYVWWYLWEPDKGIGAVEEASTRFGGPGRLVKLESPVRLRAACRVRGGAPCVAQKGVRLKGSITTVQFFSEHGRPEL